MQAPWPQRGATVSILTTPTFENTDVLGEFKTGLAVSGTYELSVIKPGYEPGSATVDLTNGMITNVTIELTPLVPFAASGLVVDADSNEPIPNATVNISNVFFNFDLTTDASGSFAIPTMFEDSYDVHAGLWGYKTNVMEGQNFSAANSSITIPVEKGYEDNFSVDLGWNVNFNGPLGGAWERGVPIAVDPGTGFSITPPEDVPTDLGNHCYVTGNVADAFGGVLINGNTRLTSPVFDLTGYNVPMLHFNYWYLNISTNGQNPGPDELQVVLNNGVDEVVVAEYTYDMLGIPAWTSSTEIKIDSLIEPTNNMTFYIQANATGFNFATEAALDHWRVWDSEPTIISVHDPVDPNIRMSVFPNPSSLDFQLNYDLTENTSNQARLQLNNVLGQVVERLPLAETTGTVTFGADLPKGIYFAQIVEGDRNSRVIKLVKE